MYIVFFKCLGVLSLENFILDVPIHEMDNASVAPSSVGVLANAGSIVHVEPEDMFSKRNSRLSVK